MRYRLVLILLLVNTIQAKAQEENSKKIIGKDTSYSFFYAGIETSTTSYINTNTKDSSGTNVFIAPYIDYNHKSGLGLRVKSHAFAGGSNPGIYLTTISSYFAKYNGKLLPYISYTRYIQHNNPSVPYSPIQNEMYAHLKLKTKYIDPMAGIDIGFGNDKEFNDEPVSDVNMFVGLSHLYVKENIGAGKNNAFGIRPGLQLNAGTDRYFKYLRTSNYISQNTKANRIGNGRGNSTSASGTPVPTNTNTYTISTENDFNLSNVEANLYVIYFSGKFSIEPSGSLYFPLRGDDKTPYGYWQINLNYWIK
jgi:hypothetical protein